MFGVISADDVRVTLLRLLGGAWHIGRGDYAGLAKSVVCGQLVNAL